MLIVLQFLGDFCNIDSRHGQYYVYGIYKDLLTEKKKACAS